MIQIYSQTNFLVTISHFHAQIVHLHTFLPFNRPKLPVIIMFLKHCCLWRKETCVLHKIKENCRPAEMYCQCMGHVHNDLNEICLTYCLGITWISEEPQAKVYQTNNRKSCLAAWHQSPEIYMTIVREYCSSVCSDTNMYGPAGGTVLIPE